MKITFFLISILIFINFSNANSNIERINYKPEYYTLKKYIYLPSLNLLNEIKLYFRNTEVNTLPLEKNDYLNTKEKKEINCKKVITDRSMIVLTFGQSNSANYGKEKYTPKSKNIYEFFNGKCYQAKDPFLGSSNNMGSVWSRLGDLLVQNSKYDNIIFQTIGVGGSFIKNWTPDGKLFDRLVFAKKQLNKYNKEYTYLLWHQGESDAIYHTSYINYKSSLEYLYSGIKKLNINSPFFVSIVGKFDKSYSKDVVFAQKEFINENKNVFLGANTDLIFKKEDRYDEGHFSRIGLEKYKIQWFNAIQQYEDSY